MIRNWYSGGFAITLSWVGQSACAGGSGLVILNGFAQSEGCWCCDDCRKCWPSMGPRLNYEFSLQLQLSCFDWISALQILRPLESSSLRAE
jgi:hypothetical protein